MSSFSITLATLSSQIFAQLPSHPSSFSTNVTFSEKPSLTSNLKAPLPHPRHCHNTPRISFRPVCPVCHPEPPLDCSSMSQGLRSQHRAWHRDTVGTYLLHSKWMNLRCGGLLCQGGMGRFSPIWEQLGVSPKGYKTTLWALERSWKQGTGCSDHQLLRV